MLLQAKSLNYSYSSNSSPLLKSVNLSFSCGEKVLISGRSGSGKTTLLYLLSGIEKPSIGEVFFQGKDISLFSPSEMSRFRRRDIGYLFQEPSFLPSLNLWENILLPQRFSNKELSSIKENALTLIQTLGLENHLSSFPNELSVGQRQKISVIRAILSSPLVVFADEPTGSLDDENAFLVMKILFRLVEEKGISLVMVSHDKRFFPEANQVFELEKGRLKKR